MGSELPDLAVTRGYRSIIRFKKTMGKFTDSGDISDVPASLSNLTNMDGGQGNT